MTDQAKNDVAGQLAGAIMHAALKLAETQVKGGAADDPGAEYFPEFDAKMARIRSRQPIVMAKLVEDEKYLALVARTESVVDRWQLVWLLVDGAIGLAPKYAALLLAA